MTDPVYFLILHLTNYEVDLDTLSEAGCKGRSFCRFFFPMWSAWTLVLVTAERVISVRLPHRAKLLCRRPKLAIARLLVTTALAAFNCPILTKYTLHHLQLYPGYVLTMCLPTDIWFLKTFMYWSSLVLMSASPGFVIFIFNVLIVIQLKRGTIGRQNDEKAKKTVTSITVMLISVSVIFVVISATALMVVLGEDTFYAGAETDINVKAKKELTFAAATVIGYINNSINFWLYCVMGSRFRQAMKNMLCGRCQRWSQLRKKGQNSDGSELNAQNATASSRITAGSE